MQPTYNDGSKGPVQEFEITKFTKLLNQSEVASVNVIKGEEVTIAGTRYVKDAHGTLHKLEGSMAITADQLDDLFSYHAPEGDQPKQYEAIRTAAKYFAAAILENTPSSPDQTVAIRKVREAVMTANASIALKGKF